MTSNGMRQLVEISEGLKKSSDPMIAAINKSVKRGQVMPHLLRPAIEAAGFTITEKKLKHLTQVQVSGKSKKGDAPIIASGASEDEEDALTHAALGYVRERKAERAAKAEKNAK